MIVFENRGEIDPQLIALLGVNVKEGEDPIGWFGTGLKISIACLARWGESIVIQSGLAEFRFDIAKSSLYTYNITGQVLLTEDRTAGEWATDPWIAKGLALLPDPTVVDATLLAPDDKMEPRLDYGWVWNPGPTWVERAQHWAATRPNDIPSSVRRKYVKHDAKICPTCKRPLPAADADSPVPF